MSIKTTKSGSKRLQRKYPKDVMEVLNLKHPYYDKTFKTLQEAKQADLNFDNNIQEVRRKQYLNTSDLKGDMIFESFCKEYWYDAYANGSTSSYPTPPRQPAIQNTKDMFRLHILPMFGSYTLNHLNTHPEFVIPKMTAKAKEYANFKALRCYVIQVFDLAEEYNYIERNRLAKPLRKIKSLKKIELKEKKMDEDKYLNETELNEWFDAINEDYTNGDLSPQDYTLFWTTFFLSCRKSECYALQWKHIDFEHNCIHLIQTLDKKANVKATKGHKETTITISNNLKVILIAWEKQQKIELEQLGITPKPKQFLFTFRDTKGNINRQVHTDYLNYRMKAVEKRHPKLKHASPHMLRHTSASLASKHGMSLDDIMDALTHSDQETTKIYVNVKPTVNITPADFIFKNISGKISGD